MNRATAALVALEDDAPPELFATVPGTGLPLWPLMRWPIASAMSNSEFGIRPAVRVTSSAAKALRTIRALGAGRRSSRQLRERADVLFVGSGNTVARTPMGLRNLLFEDFAEVAGDAVILQDAPITARSTPSFARTWSFDDAIVRSELAVRLTRAGRRTGETERLARAIVGRIDFAIEPALVERAIRTTLARATRAPHMVAEFAAVLDRVRPSIIVMQAAVYGDRSGQVAEAKSRGIFVAEAQHGWIGAAHAAYNFGAAARDVRLAAALPDALLTFGDFWGEGISAPFETVTIGKPHLESAGEHSVEPAQRERRVLIASNVVHPEDAAAFVLTVRDTLPEGWRVSFRPHPQERSVLATRYPSLLAADRVDIDDELDLYTSFARSRVVIAGPSTVLFEALALNCPVILRRSNITDYYMDPEIFPRSIGPDEHPGAALEAIYREQPTQLDPTTRERLWASGARRRFVSWETEVIRSRRM